MGRLENLAIARRVKSEKRNKQKNCPHIHTIEEKIGNLYIRIKCVACDKLIKVIWNK